MREPKKISPRPRRRWVAVLTVVPLISLLWATPAAAGPNSAANRIGAAITTADRVTPEKPLKVRGKHVTTDRLIVDLPSTSREKVRVSRPGATSVEIGVPISGSSEAMSSDDGVTTYSRAGLSAGVRVFDSGVQIATVIEDRSSSHTLRYSMSLPPGAQAQKTENGSILILDSSGRFIAGINEPWARDKAGRSIGTAYTIEGSDLVQTVEEDPKAVYPVVADPWLFVDLISRATWIWNNPYGYTLQVYPTWMARGNAGSFAVGEAGWNELYSKYKNRGLNTNLTSMEYQYICHQVVVAVVDPGKQSWNIDEWRSNVGLNQTIKMKCNPGKPGSGTLWN